MRFLRIGLKNWRNFQDVNVELQRRVFIAGPNASGKSNFLDAFRFLRDIAAKGGGLREAVDRRGGVSKIRCLAARRYSDITVEVEIGNGADGPAWFYKLVFSQDSQRRAVIKEEVVRRGQEEILKRPDNDDKQDRERLAQTHLEQVSANTRFREVAGFFNEVRYLHIVPQLVRAPERYLGRGGDPYGSDFLEQVAAKHKRTWESRLRRIAKALRVAVPQLTELKLDRDERGAPHLSGRYEHWRPHGAWQMEDQFSDGTLRLLGLLWAVLDGGGPLLLEEPELSLHPDVVKHIAQMLARLSRKTGRQIVVSTHSSDLLRDPGIGADEVLLLIPSEEGTRVELAASDHQIVTLLKSGLSIADAALPKTAPKDAAQLAMFGDIK